MYQMSGHAEHRAKNRSIPPVVLDMLMTFGSSSRSRGATSYYFDKKSKRKLKAYLGPIKFTEEAKLLNTYCVISDDGMLVTAAYRNQRFKKS